MHVETLSALSKCEKLSDGSSFSLNGSAHIVLNIKNDRELTENKMGFSSPASAHNFLNKITAEFEFCACSIGTKKENEEERETGERSFLLIKNGQLQGFGFVELNHQINNIHILESIMTPMQGDENTKFIIESYLRKNNRLKSIPLTN